MATTGPEAQWSGPVTTRRIEDAATEAHGLRMLAVVDGSERTNGIVDYVVANMQGRDAAEVFVLNVQEKRDEERLRGYQTFKQDEIDDRLVNDFGAPIVGSVSRRLGKLGIRNTAKVEIGDPLSIILRCAADNGCNVVVVADSRATKIQRWLLQASGLSFGWSVAARLAMAAPIPVVIVK